MTGFASPMSQINVAASADINPCRFIDLTAENVATQSTADGNAIGVSWQGTQRPPNDIIATTPWGVVATVGNPVSYYVPGQICNLELGTGGITASQLIKSGTAGVGVLATSTAYYVLARAIRTGLVGELVPVLILSPYYKA